MALSVYDSRIEATRIDRDYMSRRVNIGTFHVCGQVAKIYQQRCIEIGKMARFESHTLQNSESMALQIWGILEKFVCCSIDKFSLHQLHACQNY